YCLRAPVRTPALQTDISALAIRYARHTPRSDNNQQDRPLVFLEDAIRELQRSGKEVIVFKDVPNFDIDPLLNVWTERIPLRNALANRLGLTDHSSQGKIGDETLSRDARAEALLQHLS